MKLWYLDHSGVAVETRNHFLVFDYYSEAPVIKNTSKNISSASLAEGVVNPDALVGKNVIVFSSHRHNDHFNKNILTWSKKLPDIRYVFSDDISATGNITWIHAGEDKDLGDVQVFALESTDEGVAFIVSVDGVAIYHAGDLNWWHWEGETEEYNRIMGERYREQIQLLLGEKIDLAFVPVDPRLEQHALLGVDYFMRTVGACNIMPIHLWGDTDILERIKSDPITESYRDKFLYPLYRGICFVV